MTAENSAGSNFFSRGELGRPMVAIEPTMKVSIGAECWLAISMPTKSDGLIQRSFSSLWSASFSR